MNDEDDEPGRILIEPKDNIECDLLELSEEVKSIAFSFLAEAQCGYDGSLGKGAFRGKEMYLNYGVKYVRAYAELVKAFAHYRGKGKIEQKIIVQHQHVNIGEGGQAVIGNINPRRREGGGKKNGKQSHTKQNQPKQIEHAPQPTMRCQDTEGQPVPVARNAKR